MDETPTDKRATGLIDYVALRNSLSKSTKDNRSAAKKLNLKFEGKPYFYEKHNF